MEFMKKGIVKKLMFTIPAIFVLIFDLIFILSAKTNDYSVFELIFDGGFETSNKVFAIMILAFAITSIVSSVITIYRALTKKRVLTSTIVGVISVVISLVLAGILSFTLWSIILSTIFSLTTLAFSIFYIIIKDNESDTKMSNNRIITTILISLAIIIPVSIFFIPLFYYGSTSYFSLFDTISNTNNMFLLISFLVFFVLYMILLIYFTRVLSYVRDTSNRYIKHSYTLYYLSFAFTIGFFIFSIASSLIVKVDTTEKVFVVSYIPFILMGILIVIASVLNPKSEVKEEEKPSLLFNRVITLFFTICFIGILFGALFSNLIEVRYEYFSQYTIVRINGFRVISNYKNMSGGYQTLAFLIYAIIIICAILLILNISMFIRKSNYFFKTSLLSIVTCFALLTALSLFGKYYEIAEKINEDYLKEMITSFGFSVSADVDLTVSSQTVYFLFGDVALVVCLIVLKPFTNYIEEKAIDVNVKSTNVNTGLVNQSTSSNSQTLDQSKNLLDQCPQFSFIDLKEEEFKQDYENRLTLNYDNPTLSNIAEFVVSYARNSRLHLSYTKENIAEFLSGLASTRLLILEGMSGTGKTSLPKIFTEAIFGNCNIVEVESSWKDKNELIGYYNEFSKKFTPKKFTTSLYQASFQDDEITLIVLDEMNLSRIEYYFSDFLSLMEAEEDKREIKLLNTPIKNGDNEYKHLIDSTTLKVPRNIWFIGTANKDESTFEISDKVYDRASTMIFNKRAPKVKSYTDPISQKFLKYSDLVNLFEDAKNQYQIDIESLTVVKEAEKLLAPYNISFGNRILKQMEIYVSVYTAIFDGDENKTFEALESILLSKVVKKLEYKSVFDKEELAKSFESLGLLKCRDFVNKLNEDI